MLKQQANILKRISMLADLLVVFISFIVAYNVRQRWGGLVESDRYLWVMLVALPTWHFLLEHFGFYDSLRTLSFRSIVSSLLKVNVIGGIVTSSVIYFFEPKGFSRGLFGLFLATSYCFLTVERIVLKIVLSFIRGKGFNYRNIIIVGSGEKSRELATLLERHAGWGLKVLGFVQPKDETPLPEIAGLRVLGSTDRLVEICRSNPVDEIVFCVPKQTDLHINYHLQDMQELGITVRMVLDQHGSHMTRMEFSLFHGEIPILTYYSKAFDGNQLFLKRCLDLVGAVVGLSFTALVFPLVAIAIKMDSDGPIFFAQERVGENGRIFKCWKFRSMFKGADNWKKELLDCNEMNGAIFKIKDDPRVSRVGKILRKSSIDELPQFWNVLRGEMSLVGTRPPTPDEVVTYDNWHIRRISIKPGLTGLWQVSGRNNIRDFDEIVRLDLEYIDRWTLWLDIKVLFKTFWVVIARNGAS